MSFLDEVYAAGTPRTTKAEIIEYYQSQYPATGRRGSWKQRLVHDLSEITGIKPKNLEKRFDTQRINNPEKRNAAQYEELGETLPPIAPENGYHIYGTIYVMYSGDCEGREIDEEITGDAAQRLANMAYDQMLQAAANAYQSQNGDIDHRGPSTSKCGDPDLYVEAIA